MILSICDVPEVLKVLKIVMIVITIIKIAVPIILMISLMIDLTKATLSNDNDALNKTGRLSVNKAIALVLVFMIPTFVKVITTVVIPGFSYSDCINNATDEGIKEAYESVMSGLMEQARTKEDMASYNLAHDYLKNIENEELKKKYEDELKVILEKIEAKKKKEEESHSQNPDSTSSQVDPMAPYQPGLLKGDTFLQTARNVWERIVLGEKHFTYEQGNYIPITTKYCDCSSYVTWVLYEFGYTEFGGRQKTCKTFFNTNYNELYGWDEFYYPARTDLTNIVQPGDIVVRRTEASGHTDIIASVENGVVYGYDCGNSKNVEHGKYPNGVPNPYFITDSVKHRPAKIIRVKPKN